MIINKSVYYYYFFFLVCLLVLFNYDYLGCTISGVLLTVQKKRAINFQTLLAMMANYICGLTFYSSLTSLLHRAMLISMVIVVLVVQSRKVIVENQYSRFGINLNCIFIAGGTSKYGFYHQ